MNSRYVSRNRSTRQSFGKSEAWGKRAINLGLSQIRTAFYIIGRNLEEEFVYRTGDGAIPVFRPGHRLPVVVYRDYKVYLVGGHSLDIFRTWGRQSFHLSELGVRMKVPYYLQPVKPCKDRIDLFMAPVERADAGRFPGGCLKAEGMLDDEPVLKLVAQQETEAFFFINFRRTQ